MKRQIKPSILTLSVAILMLVSTVWQTFTFTRSIRSTANLEESVVDPPGTEETDNRNYRVPTNLFGNPEAPSHEDKKAVEPQLIPKSNLNLTLRGVSVAEQPEHRTALIENQNRETRLYRPGDAIQNGVYLDSVARDHVVIQRHGKLEKLLFPKTNDPQAEIIARNSAQRDDRPDSAMSTYSQPYNSGLTKDRKEEIKRRLKALRDRMQVQ